MELDEGQMDEKEGIWLYSGYIVQDEDTPYVWADNGKGKLEKRTVELGKYDEGMDLYEITSGLELTDYIAWPVSGFRIGLKTTTNVDEGMVENAIKYNNENGWVRVTLDADHKFFYVKVSDSGMGIPQESLDYIFERFYRVDKSHSREIGGTGLGLAITKSAVVAHRGAIKVQSKLGEGTTFTVRIPLRYIV